MLHLTAMLMILQLSEQEAADEKGTGDSVDHEDDDNYKNQRFQNEHKKSHSREQCTILEPASLLEEQLYSLNILRLWRSGACTSFYEAKDDKEFEVHSCYNVVMHFVVIIIILYTE